MAVLSFTTELEAVNSMLSSIGLSPVPSIEDTGIEDAARARDILRATARGVLVRGYDFNTDDGYELAPGPDGIIRVPVGALEVDASDSAVRVVVRRHPSVGLALWNKGSMGWQFAAPVPCKIVWGFPYTDLPETARAYIATSAGRQFQQGSVGATVLDRFEAEDEERLLLLLEKREAKSRGANIFRDNAAIANTVGNRRY